ncbi:MAG: hypothetical protein A6F70_02620 [Cycloclasticus sp. symbiont of Bathymodiolus heckerae]|nr:MAG: hypothetical protein A6F70_02620 [Cycloclasticus sp. symbiont of Bathymodiolus heckerae]
MLKGVGSRQQELLTFLLHNKQGMSFDALAQELGISRAAVQQHIASLERNKFVEAGSHHKTAGRPVRLYVITEAGINLFPKQYSWFSELVLEDIRETQGDEGLASFMSRLGTRTADSLKPQVEALSDEGKAEFLIKTMREMGYQASIQHNAAGQSDSISACNCVYHNLAMKYEQVCEFDRSLISTVLGKDIEQISCMAKGGRTCEFKLLDKKVD